MATPYHHDDRVVVIVTGVRVWHPHLLVGNEAGEPQKTVIGILKDDGLVG